MIFAVICLLVCLERKKREERKKASGTEGRQWVKEKKKYSLSQNKQSRESPK